MRTDFVGVQTKVLVGNSVFEDATITLIQGVLYVEFVTDDLDDLVITFPSVKS